MSASFDKTEWNFRIVNKRPVAVKAKNDKARRISVVDLATNTPFPVEAADSFQLETLEAEKGYMATLKIYTSKKTTGVGKNFVEFFEVLDVDQSAEDFIKAYWLYPDLIRFELVEVEPL